jgi:hypothetical protein
MRVIISTLFLLLEFSLFAQNIEKMSGDVYIDIESGKLSETLIISNVSNKSSVVNFILHKYLEIDSIRLNGCIVDFQKDSLRTHLMSNFYCLNLRRALNHNDWIIRRKPCH